MNAIRYRPQKERVERHPETCVGKYKLERILTMVRGVQDWNGHGLYPSSGFFYRSRRFGDWLCPRPQVDVAG
jgi:hypothetical protein